MRFPLTMEVFSTNQSFWYHTPVWLPHTEV